MAFGALGDRLAFVVDANVDGFVKGMKTAGATADKELAKTQGGLDKTGASLKSTGIGMMAFGAVALVGLGKMAGAANEAELANIKLQNSIDGNSKVGADSYKAFTDLANSLQKVTAADDESIKTGEAMLVQFGATKDQVLSLTPLVVDLSRKMGIDMATAAKTVGKALDGNSGALGRVGIQVDKAAFATDHYTAVQDALNKAVGGFAEEEGATFSGRIAILKNQLQELEEGVGKGVVTAFSSMLNAVTGATDATAKLSPQVLAGVGQWATYGAVTLGAAGALSFLAGSVLKARANFAGLANMIGITTNLEARQAAAAAAASGVTTRSSVSLAGLTSGFTLAGVAIAALAVAYEVWGEKPRKVITAQDAAKVSIDNLAQSYLTAVSELEANKFTDALDLPQLLRLRDGLVAAGAAAPVIGGVDDAITHLIGTQHAQTAAQDAANAMMAGGADTTGKLGDATQALIDKYDVLYEKTHAIATSNIDLSEAYQTMLGDVQDATHAVDDHKTAQDETVIANDKAKRSIIDYGDTAVARFEAVKGAAATHQEKIDAQVGALYNLASTLAPGSQLRVFLQQYIADLLATPRYVDTTVTTHYRSDQLQGPHAAGGRVSAGLVPVGERGPEIFVADRPGYIVSHEEAVRAVGGGGDGGTTVNVYQTFGPIYGDDRKILEAAERGARDAINTPNLKRLVTAT